MAFESMTRSSGPSHRSTALAVIAVALAMTAASCTSGGDEAGGGSEGGAAVTTAGGGDVDVTASGEGPQGDGVLFSPTETNDPIDPDGGASRTDEPPAAITGDPTADLPERVRSVTEPWTTDWSLRTVDVGELLVGIPRSDPRDAIPPIDTPRFEPIAAATWLDPREPGALVEFEGEARFYPLSILTRHEIVNDRFGDVPVAVTFCPLCNTAIAFDARLDGASTRFGVSGLLRNSDLVMWDDATTSLWQQATGEAIVGEFAGTRLTVIPSAIVSYGDVLESFPQARSLSMETGFNIRYGQNSYVGYSSSEQPFLFDGEPDDRFPALSRVVGVSVEELNKAYPFDVLTAEGGVVNDEIGGLPIAVWLDGDTADALDGAVIADSESIGTGIAFERRIDDMTLTFGVDTDGNLVDVETSSTWSVLGLALDGPLAGARLNPVIHRNEFWFAWAAFFPDAPVHVG